MTDPDINPPRRRSGTAKAILLLLAVFLLGSVTGVGGTMIVMFKRLQENVRHPEFAAGPANRFINRIGKDLSEDLKLGPDEAKAVREELETSRTELREIRVKLARDVRGVAGETVERISRRLPPEKREALRERVRERLRPWGLESNP